MSVEGLSLIAGVVLSLAFSYIPGLNKWFDGVEANYKRLIMLGLLAVTAAGAFGIACLGWIETGIVCDQAGGLELFKIFVLAGIANQSAYLISPK